MKYSGLIKRSFTKYVLIASVVLPPGPLAVVNAADLKLGAVFSEHMVLQRDKAVPIWGWGDPGEQITLEIVPSTGSGLASQKQTATADASGKWMATLEPMKSSQEPLVMLVRGAVENRQLKVEDVLVGEVWLGSGQSNMAMAVGGARDFENEKAAAQLPLIRMFKEGSGAAKTASADAKGSWVVCSPETVGGFSATLFFFGRELQRELKVPVGLINSSVGGTPIESWISEEAQNSSPELGASLAEAAKADAAFDEAKAKASYEKGLARWEEESVKAKAEGKPIPKKPNDPTLRRASRGGTGGLFNGKIAPLIPYAIRGAVWYQGESNALRGGGLYHIQLPLLVSDWRKRWGDEFPFAWVQLPNFQCKGEGWMLVQEAMLKTLSLPRTGMAIAVDIGEEKNIHPKNKQEVGRRLALWALGDVYGQKVAATSGPLPASHEVKGDEIVVSFTHCEGGLNAKEGDLKGFVIAGEDRQWKPANAKIDGDKVVVSSPDVPTPVAVRYAWAASPECNLYNGAGLPASPFRMDNWIAPAVSKETESNK